jgi:uncharacterized damage-inducible protein DinB
MELTECKALLGHAEWADSLVWREALAAPREDAELREKLHHLHTVQWAYLHIWRGEAVKPRELGTFPTSHALCDWAREYYRQLSSYLAALRGPDLPPDVRFPWAEHLERRFGRALPATWTESVLQVAMHSSYHRGQAARRLRELGTEPPLTDFIAWIWAGRPEAEWNGEDAA